MKVQPVKDSAAPLFKRCKSSKEVLGAKYFCNCCTKKTDDSRCLCFGRRIEPDYNRCYFHSNYTPIVAQFKVQDNLEQTMRLENPQNRKVSNDR